MCNENLRTHVAKTIMSEAKQLPRLAVAGPSAGGPTLAVMGARHKKNTMNYHPIGNVVPAILPMYSTKKFQRPGDVYKPLSKSSSRQTPRPLGLIPERHSDVDELPSRFSRTLLSQPFKINRQESDDKSNNAKPNTAVPTTRLKPLNVQYRARSAMTFDENVQSSTTTNPSTLYEEPGDPDYMDVLGTLNIPSTPSHLRSPEHDTHIYSHDNISSYQKQRYSVCLPIKPNKPKKVMAAGTRSRSHSLRVSTTISCDQNIIVCITLALLRSC